jgi:L-alanine-DL-glutamate epimerase-like enolase superfamily enzyme
LVRPRVQHVGAAIEPKLNLGAACCLPRACTWPWRPQLHILEVTQGYMPMMWELFNEPFDIRPHGMVHAPDRPGLGFTLRADALERFKYVDGPEFEY